MDIICPRIGITHSPGKPEVFDLYNVTETDFENCSHGGKFIDESRFQFTAEKCFHSNSRAVGERGQFSSVLRLPFYL